jgi:N-acyl-L-homoserine lactone synthetase
MIHIVTAANRAFYEPQLLQMHRQRKAVFIDRMGWKNLKTAADGGEYDEGDDHRAIYLLALNSSGDVERAMRLRPTDDWSVLGSIFPHFIGPDEAPVTNPDVWEMTRYYSFGIHEDASLRRRGEFSLAMLEKAMQCGIRRIVAISDLALVGSVIRSGAQTRVIGLPGVYDEGEAVAVENEVTLEIVETLKERLNIRGTTMLEFHENHPLAELGPLQAEVFLDAIQRLTPASRDLMTGITRAIARIEANDGVEAAIAAVERVREVILRRGLATATA